MYKTLPQTGVAGAGIIALGMTGNQMIATGLLITVVGIIVFKLVRFKMKDK
jgi:hypothetical protein